MSRQAVGANDYGWFLKKVAAAKNRALFLDYDGTIAPFSANRHRAYPYAGVRELLGRVAKSRTRLIVITGRSARELVPLLGVDPPPEIWGTYGLERLIHGRCEEVDVPETALEVLAQSESDLERQGLGPLLEVKVASVAVHWRGLEPSEILEARTKAHAILEPLAFRGDLLLAEFEEGVEIRLRAANKADAVRRLVSEIDSDVPIAYLGDDITDEEAFRALNGRGLTALVNRMRRFTAAQVWLRPPEDLIRFLSLWSKASGDES